MGEARFLQTQVGYTWILADLATKGPMRGPFWWAGQLPRLREAGYVRPSLRVHKGWEITDKGRAALGVREARDD